MRTARFRLRTGRVLPPEISIVRQPAHNRRQVSSSQFPSPAGDSDTRMEFWKLNQSADVSVAIDSRSGKQWSYSELREDAARIQAALPRLGRKSLGLLIAQNCYECLAAYLAALNSGSALILLDAALNPALLRDFLMAYRPDWVFATQPELKFDGIPEERLGRTRVVRDRGAAGTGNSSRSRPPAEHLGIDGKSEAGSAHAEQPGSECGFHRSVSATDVSRAADYVAANVVFVWALGYQQPLARGRDHCLHRGRCVATGILGCRRSIRLHIVRGCSVHLPDAAADGAAEQERHRHYAS